MRLALKEAQKAYDLDEVPVGAIIVQGSKVISASFNQVISHNAVTSHAEINAIILASRKLGNYRLIDCDIYVTLEPCHMCAKAIVDARVKNLFFGASEPKTGVCGSRMNLNEENFFNHKISITSGILEKESSELLKLFFKSRR